MELSRQTVKLTFFESLIAFELDSCEPHSKDQLLKDQCTWGDLKLLYKIPCSVMMLLHTAFSNLVMCNIYQKEDKARYDLLRSYFIPCSFHSPIQSPFKKPT